LLILSVSFQTTKTIAMKIINFEKLLFSKGRLLKALLFVLLVLSAIMVRSQDTTRMSSALFPTFGIGFGFFYPSDVNDYIQNEMNTLGYIEGYNTDLYMYFEIRGGLTYRIKSVDFSGIIEYDAAPKWVVVSGGGDNLTYYYSRIAPAIMVNYYIPVGKGRNAFFLGGGVNYSFMKFKDFNASNPGFKLQAGFNLQFGDFNLQPFGAFNYAKATDSSDPYWGDFVLSFVSGQIGVNFSFHPAINYK
jgi:hypothetical protein